MAFELSFHRLAKADLLGLYDYVARHGGTERAGSYLGRIEAACRSLTDFPEKGTPRDDITPGLRTWAFERRILIVYRSDEMRVEILRVLYGGRDFGPETVPH